MVIILMGAAGAGKTTVGQALAATLGWTFLEADDYHTPASVARLRAGIALTDVDRAPWLATLRALVARAVDRREHTVLACSALKAAYRGTLSHGLRQVRVVYLQATEPLLHERLAARQGHIAGPAILPAQLADLQEPADALTVDASWPVERIVARVRYEYGV